MGKTSHLQCEEAGSRPALCTYEVESMKTYEIKWEAVNGSGTLYLKASSKECAEKNFIKKNEKTGYQPVIKLKIKEIK